MKKLIPSGLAFNKVTASLRKQSLGHSTIGRPLTIVAFAVVFAGLGLYWPATGHAAAAPGPITGIAGKCLDNNQNLKVSYNKIQLYTCNGTDAQQWTVNATSSAAGTIVNSNGYCLDVYHSGRVNNTIVDLHSCNGTGAQQWILNGQAIVNPQSNLCLDDKSGDTADGTQIIIYHCNGSAAEQWTVGGDSTGGGGGGGGGTGGGNPSPNVSCQYQTDTWSGDASSVGYSVNKLSNSDGNPASFSVKLNANRSNTEVVGYPSDQCLMYSALPTNLTSTFNITPPAASNGLDYEYAYDIWLTTASAAQSYNWDNDLELMIWNYVNGQVPAGSVKATLADGSKVWVDGNNTDGIVSVVLPQNETTGTVNVSSIVSQLKAKGYVSSSYNGILDLEYGIEAPYGGGQTFGVNSLSVSE